jgi:hypothetical protein
MDKYGCRLKLLNNIAMDLLKALLGNGSVNTLAATNKQQ